MGKSLAYKILAAHRVAGELIPGREVAIRIDQTLTQDATGTMSFLQLEAMGVSRVRTELSVSYVDHNMLQTGFENADDHRYLQTVAQRYGVYFSRPGNGICHQVHLERFSVPGKTLLGSDSHTPTCGGAGMIAIGAGGLDVAVAMAGGPFWMNMPRILGVRLNGRPGPWVTAKDVILELLRRLTVKGGVGRILEYHGPGVAAFHVPERATITNMGAELGATTSIFPSDRRTREFLTAQGRAEVFRELGPDPDAAYDEEMEVRLDELVPLIACPHSPDNVVPVTAVAGTPVDQVIVGSCTNSSFMDMKRVAEILRGQQVHPRVSFAVAPGSRQVFTLMAETGILADLIAAGARILETACGPCIGMGMAPPSGGVSLRSFNRNFKGRSGTPDARVYLASPEVCAASALYGEITDPRRLGEPIQVELPRRFPSVDNMIIPPLPPEEAERVEVVRGPNIAPLPEFLPLPAELVGEVALKVGDHITTDHIMPAGARVLPLRSNIPKISEYVYYTVDPGFPRRAAAIRDQGRAVVVVGGENYGQGSSREHAALAPRYLGVRVKLARSFARIHRANLINFGIVPLTFVDPADYDRVEQGDLLEFPGLRAALAAGAEEVEVVSPARGTRFRARAALSARERQIILAGGLLPYTRQAAGAACGAAAREGAQGTAP